MTNDNSDDYNIIIIIIVSISKTCKFSKFFELD